MRVTLVVCVLLVSVATAVVIGLRLRRAGVPAPLSEAQLQEGMKAVAQEAVEVAKVRYGVVLDYQPRSIEGVESILAKLHDQHQRSPFSLAREKEEGWRWGVYVGEVILRLTPGHWEMDHVAGGKGSFPVRVGRGDSFPIGWCRKRILNGPEDNIWHKFQILYLDAGKELDLGAGLDPNSERK